jgi:DNA-binding transcriptional regulator YiaG
MGEPITAEHIHSARIYLSMTQGELAVELKGVGITTINRWENGHSAPTGAWRVLLENYFVQHIGKDWRQKAIKSKRYVVEKKLRELAKKKGINVRAAPSDTVEMVEKQIKRIRKLTPADIKEIKKKRKKKKKGGKSK